MKTELIQIFNVFNYNYFSLNLNDPLDQIVNQVERDLIKKSCYSYDMSRKLMAELWQLQKKENIKNISNSTEFSNFIIELQKDNNYNITDDFIICRKFIPCSAIKTINQFYILDDETTQKLSSLGYGISQYKIEKSNTVKNIYCCGKHPNVSKETGSFCMGSELTDLSINKINLTIIEESLSQFNLVSTFISDNELSSILEVIE